ncbi:MAG: flagellar basal body-associated FliL family protein [Xanthomonadaceae bacterium]|nr:flagellar basal body-associated FliL family protein [Xanthomonadaceae bacterium]
MLDDEEVETVDVPVPRKRRTPWLIGLVVVLLAAGAGGYLLLARHPAATSVAAGRTRAVTPKVVGVEHYLPLEPAFVVNVRDKDSMRYLQVGITLMSHDTDSLNAARQADPVIRDALLTLLGSQEYADISGSAGHQKLQAQALAVVRKIVQARQGRPGIDALYFTSFVVQ